MTSAKQCSGSWSVAGAAVAKLEQDNSLHPCTCVRHELSRCLQHSPTNYIAARRHCLYLCVYVLLVLLLWRIQDNEIHLLCLQIWKHVSGMIGQPPYVCVPSLAESLTDIKVLSNWWYVLYVHIFPDNLRIFRDHVVLWLSVEQKASGTDLQVRMPAVWEVPRSTTVLTTEVGT